MATILNATVDVESQCGSLLFTDTTPTGTDNGYDTIGNLVLASIMSTSLTYASLDGSDTGTIWSGTDFIPSVGNMSHSVHVPLFGIYRLFYTVTGLDDNGQPASAIVQVITLFDCALVACLKSKVLNAAKAGCGCCNGCGDGVNQADIAWMWTQLEAIRIAFADGYYDCLDAILAKLLSKCNNACKSC
jgi:hypothetical protein